jgi:hypothetical protein
MSGCRSRQDLTFQYPCSLRFPLLAGGTERERGAVPLVKRGEPTERGNCELWRRSWYQNHTVNCAERETPL